MHARPAAPARPALLGLGALALLAACQPLQRGAADDTTAAAEALPSSARLHRLTATQYRNSVHDLLGVDYAGDLPDDYPLYGYTSVGASEATLAPVELEEVETAAWAIAEAAVPDSAARDALLGCPVAAPLGAPPDDVDDVTCVRGWVASFGLHAWRRPVTGDELTEMTGLYQRVAEDAGDATLAVRATLAAFLLSPSFLYRLELGEDDPDRPGVRRLTGWEIGSRLAYFLTDAPPDDALLLAAEAGELTADTTLRAQAERLLDTDRGHEVLVRFWDETMSLSDLELVSKDATLFPEFDDAMRVAMREEERLIFEQIALYEGGSVRDLFTTDLAFADARLGAIYGLDLAETELVPVTLPDAALRGGVLGRAAFLTINANATFNSPTHRGKHVRTQLLCQDIPPPPPGVPTIDAAGTDGTLRDRLARHMEDDSCNGCHRLMDPIGFGFEHFDPVGAWQELDNNLPIDTTGDLDGVAFDGAAGLGEALSAHPDLGECFARQLYRYAKGELEGTAEEPVVLALASGFEADDLRVRELVLQIVLSDGFRTVGAPAAEACVEEQEGTTRPCGNSCGGGEETCRDGVWSGCTAPAPTDEVCDGLDNDCDGAADEGVTRTCGTVNGPGLQACVSAQWQACSGPQAPPEQCNGRDDDGDGAVDEGLAVFFLEKSAAEIAAAHESCSASSDPGSGACHAAVHRTCAASGCGTTGFALVADDPGAGRYGLACLSPEQGVVVSTSFTELSAYHGGCTASTPRSPDCNAAINRYCSARGQGTGYGPMEYSGDYAAVTCTPGAAGFETYYSVLATYESLCDGTSERYGAHCDRAFHAWCQDQGYATGFGPLENSGDLAYAACLGAR